MFSRLIQSILLLTLVAGFTITNAQTSTPVELNTTKDSTKVIVIADISSRAAEDQGKFLDRLNKVISYEQIAIIAHQNDTVLTVVKARINSIDSTLANTKSIRKLKNLSTRISSGIDWVSNNRNNVKAEIKNIDIQLGDFGQEELLWRNTAKKNQEVAPLIKSRINNIIHLLDSANADLSNKSNQLLIEVDKSTNLILLLQNRQATIDKTLEKMQNPFEHEKGKDFFHADFSSREQWNIPSAIMDFTILNFQELKTYFRSRISALVMIILSFVFLLYVFSKYKNKFDSYKLDYGIWYKEHLKLILVKHISAALITSMFVSFLLLHNRPLIVRDIISYIVIIPLVVILKTLVNKKYHSIISSLPYFMIFYTFYIVYSAESGLFRLSLLMMALYQIFILFRLILKFKNWSTQKKMLKNIFLGVTYIHLILASISFISSILGYVIVAQNLMLAVYSNIIFGCTLYICSVLFNGLFIKIIESEIVQNKFHFVVFFEQLLKRRFVTIVNLGAALSWVYLFCSSLTIEKLIINYIHDFFTHQIIFGNISFSLSAVITFFLVIYFSKVIAHIIQVILEEDILNKLSLSKGLPHTIAVMTRYTIITLGITFALGFAGVEITQLTIVLSAFGVGIGFGLQNIFNNLVSGFILLFERPIQLGDMVEVGNLLGKVKSIGIRSSNIETVDGAEVIVPNGQLVSNEVVNWTLSDRKKRIEIIVGVGYGSDTHKVKELIEGILAERTDILENPGPVILFNEIGDSSLNFRILFWTGDFGSAMGMRSDIMFRLFDVFNQNGIEMPFPQRDLNVRTIDNDLLNKVLK